MRLKFLLSLVFILVIMSSCNRPSYRTEDKSSGEGFEYPSMERTAGEMGIVEVEVKEVLQGERYSYLKVQDSDQIFWIAVLRDTFEIGGRYIIKEGVFKTDYASTEFNRTFDEIYLVPFIQEASAYQKQVGNQEMDSGISESAPLTREGSVRISEIVANPKKYDGKTVQVTGRITKVNANIMDKNWIHLQDGSDDKFDFVATSTSGMPVGHVITLKGVIRTNKDFGAGYTYEIIMEDAEIVP